MQTWALLVSLLVIATTACKYEGTKKANGETWVVRGMFVMRCTINADSSWRTEVVGCRTPKGTDVAIGKTIREDSAFFSCNGETENSNRVIYRKEVDPAAVCEGHEIGESWIVQKNFNRTCGPRGTFISNCLSDNGERIEINGQLTAGGTVYRCSQESNGQVMLHRSALSKPTKTDEIKGQVVKTSPQERQEGPVPPTSRQQELVVPAGVLHEQPFAVQSQTVKIIRPPAIEPPTPSGSITCNDNGVIRKAEETWVVEKKFTKKCSPQGATVVLNCLIDADTTINVDSEVRIGTRLHKCWRQGEKVFYEMKDDGTKKH